MGPADIPGAEPPLDGLYRDPQHYDLLAQMTAPQDLDFYLRLVGKRRGAMLELGCGTGRLSLPLAAAVDNLTGIDRSVEMLACARAKASAALVRADFVEADFLDFELGRRFDWILLPYNAINHVAEAADLARLFRCVRRHLAGQGRFVVDSFQPDPAALARPAARTRILRYLDPFSGERVDLYELNRYDAARRVNRIDWSEETGGREARRYAMEMRIFFAQEFDALFAENGFAIEAKYGDYAGAPFGPKSSKQLVVARSL